MNDNIDSIEKTDVEDNFNPLKLFNDAPLIDAQHDALNFKSYSEVIYESILGTDTPCTIGIFGEWGMGKTSMMKMSKKLLDDEKKYISVWFNAWQYENEEHTIVPLIATILKQIKNEKDSLKDEKLTYENEQKEKKLTNAGKKVSWLDKVHNALRSVASGISVEVSGDVPLLGEGKIAFNGEQMVKRYDELMKDALLEKSLYFDAYEMMEDLSSEELNEKIVIFIDDLDRCMPDKALRLLENIKLFLSQKGFVFVLGIAREIVEGHLKKRYEEDFNVSSEHGEKYLDKIVQIPIIIPSHNSNLENLVENMFGKINDESLDSKLKKILAIVLKEVDGNPRTLTRLINRIKLNARISKKITENSKIDNDNERLYYFAIACSLQEFYKDIYYELIYDNSFRKLCLGEEIKDSKENEILRNHLNKKNSVLKDFLENEKIKKYVQTWLSDDEIRKETVDFIKNNDSSVAVNEEITHWKVKNDNAKNNKEYMQNLKDYKNIDNKYDFYKYLVTNSWYDEFIKSDGYENSEFWKEEGSIDYLKSFNEERNIKSYKDLYDENENNFIALNQPVVNISWFEAKAFCEWMSSKSENYKYDLPTEEQFEYVALKERVSQVEKDKKDNEYKLFPWGNGFNQNYCNNDLLGLESTSVVGIFPDGDSPFGISDMSGNVWKWMDTDSKKHEGLKVLKGGSWFFNDVDNFSASYFIIFKPDTRYDNIGFFLTRTKK